LELYCKGAKEKTVEAFLSSHGNAMVLIKWGVVDITAVHIHRDAHL
jgi:hypothetical protein